jgi:predicted metal-dependent phosphoesterase TrpH
MFADLHLHSAFSDGTFAPEEVAQLGKDRGLTVLALTDHDTVEGCARMAAACARLELEFIVGTELTAEMDGSEIHILGYYLEADSPMLLSEMGKFQNVRQDRIREMVARLNELGIPLVAESVFRLANCRSPGRPHVGRALVEAGFCHTQDEAFERFLKRNRPAWVPKFKMSATETIDLIHRAGGVAVLAHPGLNRSDDVIPPLVEAGLDGLECYHTKHSPSTSEYYENLAEQHHLLITGGSDCHGLNKGRPLIGTIKLPYGHVLALREAANRRRSVLGMAGVG